MVSTLLALLAATSMSPSAEPGNRDAHLSVNANVIRPVEITATATAAGAVLVVRSSSQAEVHAVGGIITRHDRDGIVIEGDEATPLTVTVTY